MLNPGFVTRKALAQWQDVPAFYLSSSFMKNTERSFILRTLNIFCR
jgi:hypothetical protein